MEATGYAQKLGKALYAPQGMHDKPSLDLEVLEALTTLLEIVVVAPLLLNITMVYANVQIDDSFLQVVHDLSCSLDCASSMTAHLEADAGTLAYRGRCNKDNEVVLSPIIQE